MNYKLKNDICEIYKKSLNGTSVTSTCIKCNNEKADNFDKYLDKKFNKEMYPCRQVSAESLYQIENIKSCSECNHYIVCKFTGKIDNIIVICKEYTHVSQNCKEI